MSTLSGYSLAEGKVTGRIGVKLVIGKGCEVIGGSSGLLGSDFGSLDFGEQSSLGASVDAESNISGGGKLKIKCTDKTPYTITLNNGLNANGTQRRLSDGGAVGTGLGAKYVTYNLYTDSSRTTEWPSTGFTGTGDNTEMDLIVYGRVPVQTTPASGTYTDTVVMTVAW